MTDITIAGETFNVLVEGDENKPVLMLSNPLGTNLHIWDPQIPALIERFRVVRYDSRGAGASVANHGPYSIQGLARDALAIMDALAVDRAHWLGLSKGSMVGLWLLAHTPERMGRAVLASTAAQISGPELWNSRIQAARAAGMEEFAETVAERWFSKSFRESHPEKVETVTAMLRTTPLHGYLAACAALRDMDQRESIRGITNLVLVIAGRHDPSTPPGKGALVASSIEGAKFITLEASHISNIEDEANFTKAVVDFLTQPETAAIKTPARRKAPAKKTATKKSAAKKASTKTAAVKKMPAKKAAAKKRSAGKLKAKVPSKKTAVKKPMAKAMSKTISKTAANKKASAKRGAAKKTAGRRS